MSKPNPAVSDEHALSLQHAPYIRFDLREPFLPSIIGYTVFEVSDHSSSFPRDVTFTPGVERIIEYAIWWDWDIQHLYELEHIWVHLDDAEHVVRGEASWHGDYYTMVDAQGRVPLQDGRLLVYSEPGKHAFAPSPQWLLDRAEVTHKSCGERAGRGGVHVTPLFDGIINDRTPRNNALVQAYLEQHRFEPTYDFSQVMDLRTLTHIPWPTLFRWIPTRIQWWTRELKKRDKPS